MVGEKQYLPGISPRNGSGEGRIVIENLPVYRDAYYIFSP